MRLRKELKSMMLFNHQFTLLQNLHSNSAGALVSVAATALTFFASEKYSFIIVLVAIILDAVFGIMVSIVSGKFALSKLARVTVFKIFSYGASLVVVFMVEKLAHDTGLIGVKIAAAWAVACEFWSMSASILILWPDAYFFKIMRRHLKGEISAKLGVPVDDIFIEK